MGRHTPATIRHIIHINTVVQPQCGPSLRDGGFVMDATKIPRFAVGDKVDQSYSNHVEGTVVAVFTNQAGERRYAVETSDHSAIQIASADRLVMHGHGGK
jgi:hypothetical protein